MITRDILETFRQIELRTSRLVTAFAPGARASARFTTRTISGSRTNPGLNPVGPLKRHERRGPAASFQPVAQFGGVPFGMPDGGNHHSRRFGFDCEVNRKRSRRRHFCFTGQAAGERKSFWVFTDYSEGSSDLARESLAESRFALIIEIDSFGKFPFCLGFNDDAESHCRSRNRFSKSAITSSSGRQSSGCAKACSARRSSSAIYSCERSSSKSWTTSRIFSMASYCSATGRLRNCSTTSVALMASELTAIRHFASA